MAVPWTVWTEGWDAQLTADDGTFCVAFDVGDERGFVVFDDEGLLREMLVLVGQPGLSDVDEAFLHDFVMRRCELGDPMFALFAAGDISPMAADGPRAGTRELQYWTFQPFDTASDGSRTVLVQDPVGYRTLMVIDPDGTVIDGLPLNDSSYKGYHEVLHRLQTSRRLVADPAFGVRPDNVWPWETDCDER